MKVENKQEQMDFIILITIRQKMQGSAIYSKLKQIFPKDLDNFALSQMNSNFVDQSYALSFLISSTLPHLPIDQIHTLCRRQQKNVLQKIQQIKHIDLYSQIARVCPSQKDLRTMPTQQVLSKISQFNAKMALEQKLSQGSDQQEMIDYSELQEAMAEQSGDIVQPMEIHEMNYQSINSIKGLNNIFEQEYHSHSHLAWNEMCIYDLN